MLTRVQDQLQSHELELETVRAAHQALASRCEMLDSIARASQEKLKWERAEHIRYEEHLQTQVQSSIEENASLVASLNELQGAWSQRMQEQMAPADYVDLETNEDHQGVRGRDGASGDSDYYLPVEDNQQYYSADANGTSTPMDETLGYSNEENDEAFMYLNETPYRNDDEDEALAGYSRNVATASTNTTPSISPSRVDAVWNKFFENMAIVAERKQEDNDRAPPAKATQSSSGSNANAPFNQTPSPSRPQYDASSSLFTAIRKNNTAELQQLLFSGFPVNVRDVGEKGTPVHLAWVK